MNKRYLIAGTILLLLVQASVGEATQSIQTRKPGVLRVLFIGNSFTYFNDVPRLFQALAENSHPKVKVETQLLAQGGATLEDHWNQGDAKVIAAGGWDYVALQEQSTFGDVLLVNGKFRIPDPKKSFQTFQQFDSAIKKAGAKTVVIAHWKEKNSPPEDQNILDCDFGRLAHELNSIVVPVGRVWATSMHLHPDLNLYFKDDLHPAPNGSYLYALTLYRTIFGAMPKPALSVRGARYGEDEGTLVERDAQLLSLDQATHEKLAAAVEPAIVQFGRWMKGGVACPQVRLPVLPPHGAQPGASAFAGAWSGTFTLYPIPAHIQLSFENKGQPRGHLRITFEGNSKVIDTEVRELGITSRGISFVDPDGPNGGVIRFSGVLVGKGLTGVAEIENAPVKGYGQWSAARQ